MKRVFIILAPAVFFLFSCTCNQPGEKNAVLPGVLPDKLPEVKVSIKRYEKALFSLDQENLSEGLKRIQPQYSVFLDGDLDDKSNLMQMKAYLADPGIMENYDACIKKYPDMADIERGLSQAFSYFKYHFPEKMIPDVYTYISGGDFEQPIKYADSALIIALDIYLGADAAFYTLYKIPKYKSIYMSRDFLVRDCMEEMAITVCSDDNRNMTFLDNMIQMGKVMYFLDITLPDVHDTVKIKYTKEKLDWCYRNEGDIWAFLIENKLLYSQSSDDFKKFFGDGPFTTSFGKDSPPRIAIWVGWQIVRAYMKETKETDIKKLLSEKDAQKLLLASKYKPKKEK